MLATAQQDGEKLRGDGNPTGIRQSVDDGAWAGCVAAPSDGRRQAGTEAFHGTEAAARKELRKLDLKPPTPLRDQRTVADLMAKYLDHIEAHGRSPPDH